MALAERCDLMLEKIVDRGIALDSRGGAVAAWVYLQQHGVSEEVIVRVLTNPSLRRSKSTRNHTEELLRLDLWR